MSIAALVNNVLEAVPHYSDFMGIAELYESSRMLYSSNRDIAELIDIGVSRAGLPVQALIIHGGEKRVLAFGFPHPNEPIGSLTLDFLSWYLVKNRDLLKKL
ncbi:MAG TPA: hypothetical protein VNL13_01325, partial [Sulfolobales archaeon]|nr:hypothetical protein [Sulfolobales archaeon]